MGFLKVVVFLLILIFVWMLGRKQGENSATPMVAEQSLSESLSAALRNSEQSITELTSELEAVKAELTDTQRRNSSHENTVLSLQLALEEAMEISYLDSSELDLYRKIANSKALKGLGIENVQFKTEPSDHILLTLVQWQGRDSINGEARITVEWTMPAECEFTTAQKGEKLIAHLPSTSFDFRFFQQLEFDWPYRENPPEFKESCAASRPRAIEIEIIPDSKLLNPIKFNEIWSEIEE